MRRLSLIDRRLAALYQQRQTESVGMAETIADRLTAHTVRARRQMLSAAIISNGSTSLAPMSHAAREIAEAVQECFAAFTATLDDTVTRMAKWGYTSAAKIIIHVVPQHWWRMRIWSLPESILPANPLAYLLDDLENLSENLTEAESTPSSTNPFDDLFGRVAATDLAEPIRTGNLTDAERAALIERIVFPALTPDKITELVESRNPATGESWRERIVSLSRKIGDPQRVANEIVSGMAAGENVDQITKRIDTIVGKMNGSARRIARAEARRVAEQAQRETWAGLGDLLVGVQVVAVLNERTRPHHAARHGTIYYREGTPSLAQAPALPDEPNCRCTAVPVLQTPSEVENDPAVKAEFANVEGQKIPDPVAYGDWFRQADEPRRRDAVGSRRYDAVKAKTAPHGVQPAWSDFIDRDGKLLPAKTLKTESPVEALDRKADVDVMIAQRADLFSQIATRPFLIGPSGGILPATAETMLTTGLARQQILAAGVRIAAAGTTSTRELVRLAKAEAAIISREFPDVSTGHILADVFAATTLAMREKGRSTR